MWGKALQQVALQVKTLFVFMWEFLIVLVSPLGFISDSSIKLALGKVLQ